MKFDINTLVGKHKLTGVGLATSEEGYVLEIDGKHYIVYEQEDDQYRSNCAIQMIVDEDYYSKETVTNFPEQEVEITIGETYDFEYNYGVEFEEFKIVNTKDNSVILNAWTEDWHDYYPYAQFEYHPENLTVNK